METWNKINTYCIVYEKLRYKTKIQILFNIYIISSEELG